MSVHISIEEWLKAMDEAVRERDTTDGFTTEELMEIMSAPRCRVQRFVATMFKRGLWRMVGYKSVRRVDGVLTHKPAYAPITNGKGRNERKRKAN